MYPDDKALRRTYSEEAGAYLYLVKHGSLGHFCGYCRFKERPVIEKGYDGILTYVPVHGGITWARKDEAGMVYGFDCGHSGDTNRWELKDPDYILKAAEKMALCILATQRFEPAYLNYKAQGNTEKLATLIDEYRKFCKEEFLAVQNLTDNLGIMINLLCGEL